MSTRLTLTVLTVLGSSLWGGRAQAVSPLTPDGPAALANPSFEGVELTGWRLEVGATTPGVGDAASQVALDATTAHAGARALRLTGDARTGRWQAVWQDVPLARPHELELSFALRADKVRREGEQFLNANGLLAFFDAEGRRIGLVASPAAAGDVAWTQVSVVAAVPPGAVRAAVGFLLSQSGTLWIDDVRVVRRTLAPWSAATAGEAWDRLVARVAASYPFATVAADQAAWGQRAAALRPEAVAARTREAFVAALGTLLSSLHDVHVGLTVDGAPVAVTVREARPQLWSFAAVKARVAKQVYAKGEFAVHRLVGDIGYVLIGSWQRGEGPVEAVLRAMDQLGDVRGWIIDVRPNVGGAEALGQRVAGRFAAERVVYGRHRVRLGDGFAAWQERTVGPNPGADKRPVMVLQGPDCMSSTEGFLQMMRALPQVTTVGLPSYGASRNPAPVAVTTDISAAISQWENALPDGTLTEGRGVPPEVRVDAGPAAFAQGDPILERAIALLTAK